eukprot:UN01186
MVVMIFLVNKLKMGDIGNSNNNNLQKLENNNNNIQNNNNQNNNIQNNNNQNNIENNNSLSSYLYIAFFQHIINFILMRLALDQRHAKVLHAKLQSQQQQQQQQQEQQQLEKVFSQQQQKQQQRSNTININNNNNNNTLSTQHDAIEINDQLIFRSRWYDLRHLSLVFTILLTILYFVLISHFYNSSRTLFKKMFISSFTTSAAYGFVKTMAVIMCIVQLCAIPFEFLQFIIIFFKYPSFSQYYIIQFDRYIVDTTNTSEDQKAQQDRQYQQVKSISITNTKFNFNNLKINGIKVLFLLYLLPFVAFIAQYGVGMQYINQDG